MELTVGLIRQIVNWSISQAAVEVIQGPASNHRMASSSIVMFCLDEENAYSRAKRKGTGETIEESYTESDASRGKRIC